MHYHDHNTNKYTDVATEFLCKAKGKQHLKSSKNLWQSYQNFQGKLLHFAKVRTETAVV